MVRDKNPTLQKTCVICRNKITVNIKLGSSFTKNQASDSNVEEKGESDAWRLKALFIESFCMAFGLPVNHPFVHVFINKTECHTRGLLCFMCFEDVSTIHHIFWQLQSLEKKLAQIQAQFVQKLRCNYDAIPNSILFSNLDVKDVLNLELLKYDEIVKILFEQIKDVKEQWPKPQYSDRWKQACDNAKKIGCAMKDNGPVCLIDPVTTSSEPVDPVPVTITTHPLTEDHDYLNISPPRLKKRVLQKAAKDKGTQGKEDINGNDSESAEHASGEGVPETKGKSATLRKRGSKRKKGWSAKSTGRLKKGVAAVHNNKAGIRYLCVEDPEICCRTYSSSKHLNSHIRTFHKVRTFVCDYEGCSGRYETVEKLEAHKARVHEKVESTEVCEACGIELPRKDMKRHYYLRHVGIGKFSCEICSMDFNDAEEFRNHEQLHKSSEFPFSCVVCQKLFTNSIDLRGHVASNHLSSGLKCAVCGIMKPNDFLLRRHMKVHEKVKSFKCSECGKNFSSRAYLTYHVEHNHENAGKRYPCEICGKTFSYLKNCLRHMVCHQEDKPFKCKICSKTFNYSHLLKKHEEIHSNTRNYGCEICGKRFRQEQNLRQHMRSHRPKEEKQQSNRKPITSTSLKDENSFLLKSDINLDALMEIKIDSGNNLQSFSGIVEEEIGEPTEIEIETKPDAIITVPTSVQVSNGQLVIPSSAQMQPVHQIQLTLPPNQHQQQQGTTTVVFVTADQNFHWIT